jgi:hypothetical protein
MTLEEYCEYIRNPLAESKTRVVLMRPGENWTAFRRFCQERGDVELRLSDLVSESAWLPMPDEVFERVRDAMTVQAESGKAVVLLGLPGYLALLKDENKRAAIAALREWVDGASGQAAVCLLRSDDGTEIFKNVFANPRYRQAKQLVEIDSEKVVPQFAPIRSARLTVAPDDAEGSAGLTEVMLVAEDLASFIPEACDTFQKYLRYTEEHPNDCSLRRIVVASEGRELAGLSAEVRQIVCIRDFARVFYDVDDAGLSEDALRWMCGRGKEGAGKTLAETLKMLLFPEGGVTKRMLRVFDGCKGAEREAALWLARHVATKGSYLECVAGQEGVVAGNFRSAYVAGAAEWLDESAMYARERSDAIQEAGATMSGADIRQFIARCEGESTARVAPWLNCGTDAERAELLRRCAKDGFVSSAIKDVYPEAAAYLNADIVFGDATLDDYFTQYRVLKMAGLVTPDFYAKAQRVTSPGSVQSRDAMVQLYASDNGCALLVVDAMGAEWLPMLVALARERNLGMDSLAVGEVHLPTSTCFNNIYWPDAARRLPDIKRFDNIAHNGVETHEVRRAEENLAAALHVIGDVVLPNVADGLARFERVLVTADHGSSRLAALAWQSEPRLARTLTCGEEGVEVADWRYRERAAQGTCPSELEETLDGRYWVVRGYNRLPKMGGGKGFELHGGATLEERLVPVVIFSRTGQFVPKAKSDGKRAQIVEKDDFDL